MVQFLDSWFISLDLQEVSIRGRAFICCCACTTHTHSPLSPLLSKICAVCESAIARTGGSRTGSMFCSTSEWVARCCLLRSTPRNGCVFSSKKHVKCFVVHIIQVRESREKERAKKQDRHGFFWYQLKK